MSPISDLWTKHAAQPREQRTAFVLSGGASMGALQVGMLRALLERRIRPDLIVGCSVGALNGVVLAARPNLATVGHLQDVWLDLVDRDLVPTGLLPSTMQLLRKGEAIQSSDALRDLVKAVLPVDTFAELEVPFACVATNLDDAVEHWFDDGNLLDAVMASASIPAVFPAVEIDGVRYCDGAVVDDVPVQRAVELGATRIFILQVGAVDRPRPEPRRPVDMLVLAYWIARRHRLLDDLARIPDDVEVVILPHGSPTPVRYNDLSRSAQLMDLAYHAAAEHLDARAEGRILPVFGPLSDLHLPSSQALHSLDEAAELEVAHELYEAAYAADDHHVIDAEDPPPPADAPASTPNHGASRTETIGPAMRALARRVRLQGDRAIARVRERKDDDAPLPDERPPDDVAGDGPSVDHDAPADDDGR